MIGCFTKLRYKRDYTLNTSTYSFFQTMDTLCKTMKTIKTDCIPNQNRNIRFPYNIRNLDRKCLFSYIPWIFWGFILMLWMTPCIIPELNHGWSGYGVMANYRSKWSKADSLQSKIFFIDFHLFCRISLSFRYISYFRPRTCEHIPVYSMCFSFIWGINLFQITT